MKIALIDNMNNSFFAFTRYLRDLNIDAHLFCLDTASDNFKPNADTFQNTDLLKYIHKLNYNQIVINQFNPFNHKLKEIFKEFNIIIACGPMISILEKNKIRIDIVIPYGWDLYSFPFFKFNLKKPIKSIVNCMMAKYQAKGLQNSRVMIMDEGYELYSNALKKLKIKSFNLGIPMVYSKEIEDNLIFSEKWKFLDNHDFIVFNHSRQWWKSKGIDTLKDFESYGGIKRNDKVINAFAKFIKKTNFSNPILVLFEYGLDTEFSKELVKSLNIEKYVKWMPISNRIDIMLGLKKATFTTNSFRENMIDIGGVCYESLACGTCHINNYEEIKTKKELLFHDSHMLHALSVEEIYSIFVDYEKDSEKYRELAKKSKEWFNKKLGIGLVEKYLELIKLLNSDKSLTQEDISIKKILKS